MKKKKIFFMSTICSVVLVLSILVVSIILKPKNNTENMISTINLDYMTNLSLDLSNAKSIGISKNISNKSDVVPVSEYQTVSNESASSKYYLYSIKKDCSGENCFEKVKFKKHSAVDKKIYNEKNELIENELIQDEINAQINKLYITSDYTFIQFVPIVEKSGTYEFMDDNKKMHKRTITLRPEDLIYDDNGVSEFDKINYFSDEFTKSFVISNATQSIYKIENFIISNIQDGLVKDDKGLIYRISIDDNNLNFTTLFNNPNITVIDYFQDKFGNNYIHNKTINQVDSSTNTVFYTNGYYRASDNTVINIKSSTFYDTTSQITKLNINGVKKIGENLQELDISDSDVFDFKNQKITGEYHDSWNKLARIENKILYLYGASVSSKVLFTLYNISLSLQTEFLIICDYIYPIDYNTIIRFDNNKNEIGNVYYWIFDFDDTSFWDTNGYSVDYYLYDYNNSHLNIIKSKSTLILSECLWNYKLISNEEVQWNNFSIDTINSRKEYIIVKNEEGHIEAKIVSDYYSQGNKTITFQPIKHD